MTAESSTASAVEFLTASDRRADRRRLDRSVVQIDLFVVGQIVVGQIVATADGLHLCPDSSRCSRPLRYSSFYRASMTWLIFSFPIFVRSECCSGSRQKRDSFPRT